MQIQPYLFFEGRAEEAIEFYGKALGAKVEMLMHFKDSPEPPPPGECAPGSDDKVMHASLRIGDATVMMSDGRCSGQPSFQVFRYRFRRRAKPRHSGGSPRSVTVGKCRCRWVRPFLRAASA